VKPIFLKAGTLLNRRVFNRAGLHLTRADKSSGVARSNLLRFSQAEELLDIGAHVGAYGKELRSAGFRGRIVSIEPNPEPLQSLHALAKSDGKWIVVPAAVADKAGRMNLNISANAVSSSLLPINNVHVLAAPESSTSGQVEVDVITVDSMIGTHRLNRPLMVKIDVQGAEHLVLDGAKKLFHPNGPVRALEIELSAATLYEGQALYLDLLVRLEAIGFQLWSIDPGMFSASGQILQFDVQLVRVPSDENETH
jgi:FkbM family methyltransferase